MEILKLRILNFMAIGDSGDLALSNRGLVLLQGENLDDSSTRSNGAGKSSIPDALTWALYGETARGESGDKVVNRTAKKNCLVVVTLQDGDSIYEIQRARKHDEFKNQSRVRVWNPASTYPIGTPVDLTKGTEKETQAVITDIVGSSLEVFNAAIYAGQENIPDIPAMTDKQLKLLIEEAAGIERIERAYEIARGRMNEAQREYEAHIAKITNAEAHVARLQVQLNDTKKQRDEYEAARAPKIEAAKARHAALVKELRSMHAQLVEQDEAGIKAKVAAIDQQLAEHSALVAKVSPLRHAVEAASRDVARAETRLEGAANMVRKIKHAIENAAEEMSKPCPECGRPHTADELEQYKQHMREKLKVEAQRYLELKAEVEAKRKVLTEAQHAVESAQKAIPDVSELNIERANLQAKLNAIDGMKRALLAKKAEIDTAKLEAEQLETSPNPYAAAATMKFEEHAQAVKALEELKAATEELQIRLTIAKDVVSVFGPAGVRAHILDTVTPFLNERTAEYLTILSDGNISAVWTTISTTAKGELKEKFTIEVESTTGANSFKGLSGGEKRKVRLATMLALQDLVASRATKPINLWIGDEIDDALDDAGLERLMALLERKAREKGTVLVVSHADLKDWIDNVAVITKEGGRSTVSGALSLATV